MQNPAPAIMKFLPLSPVPGPRRLVPAAAAGQSRDVVVIGAGLAGLTAALHLLGAGHRVTVVDSADHVGGRCATEDVAVPGAGVTVRADTGATVWTMPQLVESALAAVGKRIADVDPDFQVRKLSPAYHATFHDGRSATFDSVECAAAQLAPECGHCGCRILGHGIETDEGIFCCAHCARKDTNADVNDRYPVPAGG